MKTRFETEAQRNLEVVYLLGVAYLETSRWSKVC